MDNVRVDFTEGQIFTKNKNQSSIEEMFRKMIGLKFPWNTLDIKECHSDEDLDYDNPEKILFFTGTTEQIKFKKNYVKMTQGKMCECCGSPIVKFPWDFENRYRFVSSICARDMEKEYGKDLFGMPRNKAQVEEPWWLL